MKNKLNRSIKIVLPIALLFLFSCAAVPKMQSLPPAEEFRANLGTIGVVSGRFQPEVAFQKPMTKGAAAGYGAGVGSLVVLQGIGNANYGNTAPGAALVALGLIPVGAAIGSIVGAIQGIPSSKIKASEDALNDYLATVDFQETMRERFLSVAREQTQNVLVLIEEEGPNALDEEVTYGSLSDKGIDTVFEISVRKCDLRRIAKGINPSLRLLMAVGIRLIRPADGTVLYSRNFVHDWGDLRKFSDWAVNDAQPFREALDHAFQYLATEIVNTLSTIQTPLDPQPSEDIRE